MKKSMGEYSMKLGYGLAMLFTGLLALGSYWVMQESDRVQSSDDALVNLSGRQRMLSQRIGMFSIRLVHSSDPVRRTRVRRQLIESARQMETAHKQLINDADLELPHTLTRELRALYFGPPHFLDSQIVKYTKAANELAKLPDSRLNENGEQLRDIIDSASSSLLVGLEQAVYQFELVGEEHISFLKKMAMWILIASFIVLFSTAIFVFRPIIRRVLEEQQELKRLNETLEQRVAERTSEIAQLRNSYIHNVNHELRTPITCINASLQAYLDDETTKPAAANNKFLDIALRNTRQLNTMIDDLLDVTRAETGKLRVEPRSTSIADLISETLDSLQLIANEKKISLHAAAKKMLPAVYVDPVRIRQVLINLISNAIKFTPVGGKITVQAEPYDEDPNFLRISVSDTGHGIKPEDAKMVFDRLYQVQNRSPNANRGLGLGLFICKELVSRHHGRIWVESQVGKGSTFYFTLPIFSFAQTASRTGPADGMLG